MTAAPTRALLIGLATATVAASTALPARAAEDTHKPVRGSFTLVGRGYGHGRGMSQWGSYQQAVEGRSWSQIIAFYYPGARVSTVTSRSIRVNTTSMTGNAVRVVAEQGLTATDGTQTVELATSDAGAPISSWEVGRPSSGGTSATTTLWFRTALGRKALRSTEAGRWTIRAADGSVVALNSSGNPAATYLGSFTGHRSGSSIIPVLTTTLEDYTRQVVPWENIASWPVQAQAAQSVAARSYGAWHLAHPRHRLYDICDTTSCQVFRGIGQETANTRQGVAATAGRVLTLDGAALRSEFSASNGGQTAPAGVSYTSVQPDPYEMRLPTTVTTWTGTLSAAKLAARFPQVGTVTGLAVTSRDGHGQWGGRVRTLRLTGTAGSVQLTPAQIGPLVTGWKGAWFTLADGVDALTRDCSGDGRAEFFSRGADGSLYSTASTSATGFAAPRRVGSGWLGFRHVTTGQFTADRLADALAVTSSGEVRLYASRGTSWAAPVTVATGLGGYSNVVLASGLVGGKPVVLARRSSDGALVSFAASGTGTMSSAPTVISPAGWNGRSYTALVPVRDITGDGRGDLVVRASNGELLAWQGDGTGRFTSSVRIGTGWQPFTSITTPGDVNADGRSDVVARLADGTTRVYRTKATGGFSAYSTTTPHPATLRP